MTVWLGAKAANRSDPEDSQTYWAIVMPLAVYEGRYDPQGTQRMMVLQTYHGHGH